MRFAATTAVGMFVAALALTSPAAAFPSLSLNPLGGGQYLILLTVGPEGLASLQWDVTSESGVPDSSMSIAVGFNVPSSDPVCETVIGGCNFSAAGPFANAANPTGLNGFAVFVTNPAQALMGPAGPFTVGLITFSNAGSEGVVSIPFGSIQGTCGSGEPIGILDGPCVPEPATSFLLGLALLGLGVVARGRSSRAD